MFDRLPQNLAQVRDRIEAACDRSGRSSRDVTLIAVTKGHPFEAMEAALSAGLCDLGENRVQEALPKLDRLPAAARVHLIGQLQTNKVNKAVGRFASIQSVDRVDLLDRIERRAAALPSTQPMWVQVNASAEAQKAGCDPSLASDLWERARGSGHLRPLGLMTMARFGAPERELRETFARLRRLAEPLRCADGTAAALSMGMSDDFEVAIEEGATHVRLGTVLFGPRG